MQITFNFSFFEIFGILCLTFICSMLVAFIGYKITCWYENKKYQKKQAQELADFTSNLANKNDWELETALKFYQKHPKYRKPEYTKLIKAEIQSRKQTDEAIFQAQLQNASDVALAAMLKIQTFSGDYKRKRMIEAELQKREQQKSVI